MNIEPLESRIAPATLVNPTTVTYTDVDGDDVTVKVSKGTLSLGNFVFLDIDPGPGTLEQLQRIDLNSSLFDGANLTITAKRNAQLGGDGFANVGRIASFLHLGAVTVDGDLGQIDAGDSAPGSIALKSLTVQSLGRAGVDTQQAGGDLKSGIAGGLGSLTVKDDVVGASVNMTLADASIGSVKIGGSLLGVGASEGQITSAGAIGKIQIGGDVRGGGGTNSGSIFAASMGAVTIGGSIIGGGSDNSGYIVATTGDMGLVKIGGSLLGGAGQLAGTIRAAAGEIAGVTVGGSLIGSSGIDGASIYVAGDLGPVKIGGDVRGSAVIRSAVIQSDASITSVTVGGSLLGGAQLGGRISATANLGPVTIGGSVRGGDGQDSGTIAANGDITGVIKITGDLVGGAGFGSGGIFTFGKLAGVSIGGSVIGGSGPHVSGQIHAGTDMGKITIGGDLRGVGADTANIVGEANVAGITIGGSIIGGAGGSGQIRTFGSGDVGPIVVKGGIFAGSGASSGHILIGNGDLAALTVGGSLVGGAVNFSGAVQVTNGDLGPVKIGGDMIGGGGNNSGAVIADNVGAVTVGGGVRGSGGVDSGSIRSEGALGVVKIGRDVTGGANLGAGSVVALGGAIGGVTIGGSLVGGFANQTGQLFATGDIGAVKIGGDIRGGSAFGLASVDRTGYIEGDDIKSVTVGGSVVSGAMDAPPGTVTKSGSIRANGQLGAVVVKGSLVGNLSVPVIISARGADTGAGVLAIKSLSVTGRVESAQILAGYNPDLVGQNANAQIGAVTVGLDWVASSIAAGVLPVDGFFGNSDDAPLGIIADNVFSKIASITIKGAAFGTPATISATDHFGFVAQQIGSLKVGGTAFPLTPGAGNDLAGLAVGATGDLRVREVAI